MIGRNWRNISYLSAGTSRQRSAHDDLQTLGILESLAEYDPVLVSTVAIDIDISSSDLDIICEAYELAAFERRLRAIFGTMERFQLRRSSRVPEAVVSSFFHGGWEYEVFAQPVPVERQVAFRHLRQTFRVVTLGGEPWRVAIRLLKEQGMKTEPAVAFALRLSGNPYDAVLSLVELSDGQLASRMVAGPWMGCSK